jgi:transcriptional regulator with XRE-family HTH domain
MIIGDRLREIREQKNLSQGDVEQKTGLLRGYISRLENGHTIPAIATLERLAKALEVPLHQFFYDGEKPPALPTDLKHRKEARDEWGDSGKPAQIWHRFRDLLGRMNQSDRNLLLSVAQKMAGTKKNESI